jgi:asparagine synthase (glutamine-hydrolysing)
VCGIFGAVFAADVPAINIDAALASIIHRGPDGIGIARGHDWILGHRRLAVLDLTEAGAQPMSSADGLAVVAFNGEIYNHHELRRELESRGHRFRSRSDTEVIVEGYRAWGEGIVQRLDGMFAIGIWDAKDKKLLLARDRAGKKPLFYTYHGGELRFASEIKALAASGVPIGIDEGALPFLFALGYVPAPGTLARGVMQLAPASTLVLASAASPIVRRYWRAPFGEARLRVSEQEACTEVRHLIEQAVARRLESDVPLGAFLSGGLDSTIVVGMMARKLGRKVKTFSIGFAGDARFDETRYARIAARVFDTDHTEFVVEPSSFDLVERLVELHDGPFGDASAVPTSIVSMLTRRSVTVALTGDGGDELFCGYPRFLAAEAAERVPGILRTAAGHALSALPRPRENSRTPVARAHRLLWVAAQPMSERLVRWISFFDVDRLLTDAVRRRVDVDNLFAWSRRVCEGFSAGSALSTALGHNFETYLPDDLLVKADRCSMGHSLEVRSPFLDRALIEYVARLPDRLLRRGRTTKWLLRNAFRGFVPQEILTRSKMGFGAPLGTWFRGTLRSYIHDMLHERARCYEFVDRKYVENVLRRHMSGTADHGLMLWMLLTFEVWLGSLKRRQHVGGPSGERRASPAKDELTDEARWNPRNAG